ncbi:MAG: heparin lyase I family protein [Pseudomonadota bacterium]
MRRAPVIFVIAALVAVGVLFGPYIWFVGKGVVYNAYNMATADAPNAVIECGGDEPDLAGFRIEAPTDQPRITPLSEDCGWRFTLHQGQPRVKAGFRTEMRTHAAIYDHATRYCFSVNLPEPWPDNSPIVTLAQWHAVPDRVLGEKGRSPPLRLQISNGVMETAIMADPARVTGAPFDGGDPPVYEVIAQTPAIWNAWSRWCFDAEWRAKGEGRVDVHLDGVTLAQHEGALGYHDFSAPFFKFGVYVPGADETPGGIWRAEFKDVELLDIAFEPLLEAQ